MVVVTWFDACQRELETELIKIKTIGFLTKTTKLHISLAMNIDEEGTFRSVLSIPKCQILETKECGELTISYPKR